MNPSPDIENGCACVEQPVGERDIFTDRIRRNCIGVQRFLLWRL